MVPVNILVTTRSAIGTSCAIAEVSTVANDWVSEIVAVGVNEGSDRLLVRILAVIVTENVVLAGIAKIGS